MFSSKILRYLIKEARSKGLDPLALSNDYLHDFAFRILQKDMYYFREMSQTKEIIDIALKAHPRIISLVKNPTEEQLWYALKTCLDVNYTIRSKMTDAMTKYVVKQGVVDAIANMQPSEKFCRFIINKWPNAIDYIRNPSDELARLAFEKDQTFFRHLKNPSIEDCYRAIAAKAQNIIYVKNPTDDMWIKALKSNPLLIRNISNPSQELIDLFLETSPHFATYLKNKVPQEFFADRLDEYGYFINFIDNPTEDQILTALRTYEYAAKRIDSEDLWLDVLRKNPNFLTEIPNPTIEMLWIVAKTEPDVFFSGELGHLVLPEEIQEYLVDKDFNLVSLVSEEHIAIKALKRNPLEVIRLVCHTRQIMEIAIDLEPQCVQYMENVPEDLAIKALKQDGTLICYCEKTELTWKIALEQEPAVVLMQNNPLD